ncbi:MAG: DUF2752 domain-containing protein [Bacteroidales bacterium]
MKQIGKNFYLILFFACLLGYGWLIFNTYFNYGAETGGEGIGICPIKIVTGFPCPSCGSTRSVMHIFHGEIRDALRTNPIGFILFLGLTLSPPWILFDIITEKMSLYLFFLKVEKFVRVKSVAIILTLLVVINWIWNFYKGF